MLEEKQVSGQVLDHLGLVMSAMDKIGLIDKINARLPVDHNKGAKVSMGHRIAAMILNGLGYIDDRLYMFPEFLENKPVDRLFGPDLQAKDFNDDALGRCLDAIHKYGTTKLFSEIAFEIGTELNLLGKTARFDTTSLSVYGDYQQDQGQAEVSQAGDQKEEPFQITYGYSKDGRPDLKQMVVNLATTGKGHMPIWFSAHSGNASDKVILQQAAEKMKKFADALKEAPSFLFVGDSAMYEQCVSKAGDMLWLSRVPHSHKQAKSLLSYSDQELNFEQLDKGYQVSESLEIVYKNVKQRWVVVFSEQAYQAEDKTLSKKIDKEYEQVNKKLWHLSHHQYACKKDAHQAIKPYLKGLKYHHLSYEVTGIYKHVQAGRPKADSAKELVGYKLLCSLIQDESLIEGCRIKQGKFILATNQLSVSELSEKGMLQEYKEQQHTEAGFKFIKSDAFEVSSVFLKKPSRVESLLMVMTLCLMVYNLSSYFLHSSLVSAGDSVPNQLKKPTQKPSMSYIFRKFHGIHVIKVEFSGYMQELVINLNDLLIKIINHFGSLAMRIYGLSV